MSSSAQQPQPQPAPSNKIGGRTINCSRGRLIRRYSESENGVFPFIRFGPLFGEDDRAIKTAKEDAWQYVISLSKTREAIITEIYISAIRQIEKEARGSYAPDPVLDKLSGKDFREMMLKDSCLFLQLSLSLLQGGDDNKVVEFPHLRNSSLFNKHKWVKSMFHVGNQIPLVVLRVLLKQTFFQEVIKKRKWKEPSLDQAKISLFRTLLSPVLESKCGIYFHRGHRRRVNQQLNECCDVLHGLHLLLLGPEIDRKEKKYHDENDDDVDSEDEGKGAEDKSGDQSTTGQGGSSNPDGAAVQKEDDDKAKPKNAAELKQAGIHFKLIKGGIRAIKFKSNLIYPKLYLPPLLVGSHSQFLLECLGQYESSQNLDPIQDGVNSYLQFMRDLVRTVQDAKILASDGIIKGNPKYTQKLPTILRDLVSDEKILLPDTNLSSVKIEINSFYRPPWVSDYFTIVFLLTFFGMLISITQTVYAVLAYHKPPGN